MTTYLGKSCSFGLPRVAFVNCRQFMYLAISLLVLRAGCGIVSVPDHCLSFYLSLAGVAEVAELCVMFHVVRFHVMFVDIRFQHFNHPMRGRELTKCLRICWIILFVFSESAFPAALWPRSVIVALPGFLIHFYLDVS